MARLTLLVGSRYIGVLKALWQSKSNTDEVSNSDLQRSTAVFSL
jgi:hypothetical protein